MTLNYTSLSIFLDSHYNSLKVDNMLQWTDSRCLKSTLNCFYGTDDLRRWHETTENKQPTCKNEAKRQPVPVPLSVEKKIDYSIWGLCQSQDLFNHNRSSKPHLQLQELFVSLCPASQKEFKNNRHNTIGAECVTGLYHLPQSELEDCIQLHFKVLFHLQISV